FHLEQLRSKSRGGAVAPDLVVRIQLRAESPEPRACKSALCARTLKCSPSTVCLALDSQLFALDCMSPHPCSPMWVSALARAPESASKLAAYTDHRSLACAHRFSASTTW